jgi:hypothetical protein
MDTLLIGCLLVSIGYSFGVIATTILVFYTVKTLKKNNDSD